MAQDPRYNCPPGNTTGLQRESRLQARKKGFFDAIGNLGKIEALNEAGFGDVRQGLEVLARVSDSVRSGSSVVPGREGDDLFNSTLGSIAGTAVDAVDNGVNAVLDATGIGRTALDAVNGIDAGVANRAYSAAESVFDRVKAGNFSIEDIPGVFSDLQNVETLVRGIFYPTPREQSEVEGLNKQLCYPSPWATDLISHAPRFKFMYIVDIKFAASYSEWNDMFPSGLAFQTKSSTRPQVEFEYDEVNMYNFWTQIIKRTRFSPVTMRFIDDHKGNALRFYAAYMKAISPITNRKFIEDAGGGGSIFHEVVGGFESDSMKFDGANGIVSQGTQVERPVYSASVGALNENTKNLLSSISLYHIGNYGDSITAFHMYNPRISSLQPDDVDQAENGDGSEFSFEFTYDSLHVDPQIAMSDFTIERLGQLDSHAGRAKLDLNPIGISGGAESPNTAGNNKSGAR